MADISEVTSTLAALISAMLYPTGTANPPAVRTNTRVYVGWPVPEQLASDLASTIVGNALDLPICHVSVFPLPAERNTTRYLQTWQQVTLNTPTLTLTAIGQTVTVGGTIPPASNPHNAVIFANGIPYVYAVQPGDTLNSIAASLATLIAVSVPGASSAGPVVTLPASARLGAVRIGVTGTSMREISRQEKQIQIVIWADSPDHRSAIAKIIDPALKALSFIALPDLTAGRIRYCGNRESDHAEKQGIYRRDLMYSVEYGTFQSETETQITQIETSILVGLDGNAWSADSTDVTADSTVFTSDANPPPGITVYQ